jgi:hypothetical protein
VNSNLHDAARAVLTVVAHARNVFGGDTDSVRPPAFTAARDLEDDLGCGHFRR